MSAMFEQRQPANHVRSGGLVGLAVLSARALVYYVSVARGLLLAWCASGSAKATCLPHC